ncbi:substrate-binding domain-containing protein [bacterium]|nr:substrate-binding domain-containing protein [bacterium]
MLTVVLGFGLWLMGCESGKPKSAESPAAAPTPAGTVESQPVAPPAQPATGAEAQPAPAPARKWRVGFSHSNYQEPWRIAMKKAAEREAEKYKDILDFEIHDGRGDNTVQKANTEAMLTKGIDLLIISPHEAAPQTPPVAEAYNRGIKVLVLDRKIVGDTYNCFIGGDNVQIGQEAGKWAVEQFKGKEMSDVKTVILQGQSGATPTKERQDGFMSVINEWNAGEGNTPKFTIVFNQICDYDRDKAKTQMENALQANPRIDLVYAHNDPMAIGAYLAANAAGRRGEMKIIGIDALCDPDGGVQAVIDGKIDVTFVYPPLGKEAIELAVKLLRNEPVEKNISLPTIRIDSTNAASYMEANK